MSATRPVLKPRAVTEAVIAVWVWILFLAVSGIYQAQDAAPQLRDALAMADIIVPEHQIFLGVAGAYLLGALTMVGVAYNLNSGHSGARTGLLIAFLFDFVVTVFSFEHTVSDFILTPIDIGLQCYALWKVYTAPGKLWFRPKLR